jgi:hypothetical protein
MIPRDWTTLQRTVMCSEHGNREKKNWRWPEHYWTFNLLTYNGMQTRMREITDARVRSQSKEPVAVVGQQLREDNMDGRRRTDAHSRHFPGQMWKPRRIFDRVAGDGATTWTRNYWPRCRNASFAKYLKLLQWNDPISQQRPRQGLVVTSNRFTASPLHYEYSTPDPFLSIYPKSQINERDLTQVTALFCQAIRFAVFCISTHVSLHVFWISRTNFRAYTQDGQNNGNSCERFTFLY